MRIFFLIALTFFTGWCSRIGETSKEEPLAKVGKQYLYPSELKGLFRNNITKEDSVVMIASLTEKWVRKQLIEQKAELNLSDEEKDVNKELDEYRTSLIIYKYEQKLIKEKLDTVVHPIELEKYYDQNISNFILNYDIVKALYIKLPIHAPGIEKVKEWMRSESEENIKKLEGYCFQYAVKYEYFKDEWVNFDNIKMLLPVNISDNKQYLKNVKFIELKDTAYYYFVNIKDYKTKGSDSPLKFVESDIKTIILLKRKQKLINDLENKIYFDAIDRDNIKIYKK
jgi:hypothetical protein